MFVLQDTIKHTEIPIPRPIWEFTDDEFIQLVSDIDRLQGIRNKLDFYYLVTGENYSDNKIVRKVKGENYEWTIPLRSNEDYNERGKWFLKSLMNP